ncbi:MAG: ribonuclease Z [Syntrophorhabdus sp. PtaU1.Bin050]|nr:MAG: ribonuclease Z [Syntrophorhabdus sp. PtaU1.Bin050]
MEGFVKFFGTGGARFVVTTQVRSTGGLLIHYKNTNLYIDPGPGALVRVHSAKERYNLSRLDGIVLTHKHLDHSNDVNIMIEAMTEGGFKKRGILFCPEDAVDDDPIVRKYVMQYLDKIEIVKEGETYTIKDITFTAPVRHMHPVETYGFVFHLNKTIGLIADTRYFEELPEFYRCDYIIANVLRKKPIEQHDTVAHLSVEDFARIITEVKPEVAIMTHFGLNMIREKPYLLAEQLKDETGIEVIAAYDGMKWAF